MQKVNKPSSYSAPQPETDVKDSKPALFKERMRRIGLPECFNEKKKKHASSEKTKKLLGLEVKAFVSKPKILNIVY